MSPDRLKVAFVTSPDRVPIFCEALERAGIEAEVASEASENPAWRKRLTEWDRLNFDVAVIDDAAIADKGAMEAGMRFFQAVPRPPSAHMRLIFFSGKNRDPRDPLISLLASEGVYDLVLPFRDESPLAKLVELVERPAKRNDVLTLLSNRMPTVITDPSQAPAPISAPITEDEQTKYLARGQSVISVSGTMPRAGATTCSIALVRTLKMLDQEPALVVDEPMFAALKSSYPAAESEDGKSFRVSGIDVFCGVSASVVPRRYSHVVLDLGYLGWGREAKTEEAQQAVIEFNRADLQIVYIPCFTPKDFEWMRLFMKSCHPADISRYALGIWGANEELFERIESEVRSKAKDAYMWAMPPISWPLSLDTRIEGLVGALEPVLPRRTKKNKRKAKRKMLKMPWRRGGEDG